MASYKKGQLKAQGGADCGRETVPVIQFGFFMQPRVFLIKCRIMNFTCEPERQTDRQRERGRERGRGV